MVWTDEKGGKKAGKTADALPVTVMTQKVPTYTFKTLQASIKTMTYLT